jgi:acyl carrier protein
VANSSDVEQIIKDYIMSEFLAGEDPAQLTGTTPLITAAILTSIATLKLVLFLEERFSITINPHEVDADHMDTIERIGKLVRSKG